MINRTKKIVLYVTFLLFSAVLSNAFVPNGDMVLDVMLKKLKASKTFVVKQNLVFMKSRQDDSSGKIREVFPETLKYVFPDKFRSDIVSDDMKRVYVALKGQSIKIINGQRAVVSDSGFELYKELLLLRSKPLLKKRLDLTGVDLSVVSLGRIDGNIAYVIGANYPDESMSQLWVDRKTFLPVKWVVKVKSDELFEFYYKNWRKKHLIWYPMRIESYLNKELMRVADVLKTDESSKINYKDFDIKHLEFLYPFIESEEEENSDEIQETIKKFTKIYK